MTPRSSNGKAIMISVDNYTAICTSVQTVQLCAQNSLTILETKVELDSYADTCVVGDYCLVVHNHNKPMNVFGYDPKA